MRIFCVSAYNYWGDFLPTDLDNGDRQIGGGETAMMQMARALAKRGHEVVVFYDIARPGKYDGVDYMPTSMFQGMVCSMEHDVLVSWDNVYVFRFAVRSKMNVLAFQLNDTDVGIFDTAIDRYFHPSEWHRDMFIKNYSDQINRKKCRSQMTNGIDPNRYVKEVKRLPKRVIYSSSPDRGLHHLLRIWPNVLKEEPEAELHVFYDMDRWLAEDLRMRSQGIKLNTSDRADLIRMYREDGLERVYFHGGVGQKRLAIEQMQSHVQAYPCDPVRPTEGFSMTCLEAICAGCELVITDADALKELWASAPNVTVIPLPVDDATWVDALVTALRRPPNDKVVHTDYMWSGVARKWEKEFEECLSQRQH